MDIIYCIPPKTDLHYRVAVKTRSEKAKRKENILTYDCAIREKRDTMKGFVINFKRTDILLNNTKIHEPVNEILLLTGKVLHDLDLGIDTRGEIFCVKNIKEIQKYWQEIRFGVESAYKGEIVGRIVDSIDGNINDEALMIKMLDKDPFFFYYLKGIYAEYINGQTGFSGEIENLAEKGIFVRKKNRLTVLENGQIRISSRYNIPKESIERLKEEAKNAGVGEVDLRLSAEYLLSPEETMEDIHIKNELLHDGLTAKSFQVDIERKRE